MLQVLLCQACLRLKAFFYTSPFVLKVSQVLACSWFGLLALLLKTGRAASVILQAIMTKYHQFLPYRDEAEEHLLWFIFLLCDCLLSMSWLISWDFILCFSLSWFFLLCFFFFSSHKIKLTNQNWEVLTLFGKKKDTELHKIVFSYIIFLVSAFHLCYAGAVCYKIRVVYKVQ